MMRGVVRGTAIRGAALTVLATAGLHAQPGIRPTGRVTLTSVGADNLCAKEAREGASLARLPEGLALLRMRSDLEAVSRLETVRPATSSNRRLLELVRREVDSLALVLERVVLAAPRRDLTPTEIDTRLVIDTRVRQLTPRVDVIVESALQRVVGTPVPAPKGYFGVTISSVPLRTSLQSGYIVSYCDYPVVEAVDPGSPAERAGLAAGDTIVAFNGRDVRAGMVDYSALLAPAANVRVRTRRDGRTRETTVRVATSAAPAPVRAYARALQGTATLVRVEGGESSAPVAASLAELLRAREMARGTMLAGATMPGEWYFEQTTPDGVRALSTIRASPDSAGVLVLQQREASRVPGLAPVAPPPPVMLTIFANADDAMVGGAQLRTLGAEFRAALSLPEGVLVMQVLRGTPASVAGLREGDVIRSANGQPVRRVDDVRTALEMSADARTIALRVVRNDAPERTVTMTW
jgi:membrane-associated protease RseP (regulator of RpoE activity)